MKGPSLSNTVTYLLQSMVASLARLENGWKGEKRPRFKRFSAAPKKAKTTREPVARFKYSTSDEEMAVLSKGTVPANTQKNNAWAMRVFSEWRAQRNGGNFDKAQ